MISNTMFIEATKFLRILHLIMPNRMYSPILNKVFEPIIRPYIYKF